MEERANIVEDKIVIPGRELNNFDEIGYTWDDLIPLFKKFGMERLVLIEQECIQQNYYTTVLHQVYKVVDWCFKATLEYSQVQRFQ